MGAAGGDVPSEDQFNRVSFLSHFEGANNGVNNAFDDGSANNHTITAAGNVTQGSFGPFARPDGEWGWSFDGDGDSLTFTNDATMSLDGDYTFELFFNTRNIVLDTQHPNIFLAGTTQLYIHASSKYISWYADGGNIVHSANDAVLTNVWNHVAVVRSGSGSNNTSMYLNGTRVQQASNTATLGAGSGTARIGSYSASGGNFDGHISNIRILKGTALYSGSSITVPTSALTAITNTKLLTCQSNRFIDNSSTGFALTPVGNAAVTAFGPFLTSSVYDAAVNGASAYFDGSGDYLSTPSVSIGTGTFSFECWVYPIGITDGNNDNIVRFAEGNGSTGVQIYITNSSSLRIYKYSGGYTTFSNVFLPNQWYKLLFVRESNTLTSYVNGVSVGTYTVSDNLDGVVRLGANGTGELLTGYMSGARLSNNARQSGNYTVETAPFTTDNNTTFLLNMADAQAIDSAAQNNLTLYGTAKTSTGQAKFGNTSLLLDGNSDYAIFPNGATGGAGDWTIEMFIFPANVGSGEFGTILDNRPDDTNGTYQTLVLAAATLKFYVGGSGASYRITSDDSLSANTWYHVALCKSGSSTKLFIDGTQTGSTFTDNVTYVNIGRTIIGAEASFDSSGIDDFFNGYIDEMRLSSFARYTSNFTAPAEPFADKGQ